VDGQLSFFQFSPECCQNYCYLENGFFKSDNLSENFDDTEPIAANVFFYFPSHPRRNGTALF